MNHPSYRVRDRHGGSQTRLPAEVAAKVVLRQETENSPQLAWQALTILPNEAVEKTMRPRIVLWFESDVFKPDGV